ncbi:MAG TPA: MFS transporter [Allosphingosinicella sp.]|jgi:EmrB/QacA subfamily drug resistance transporter|nr:MFS transporter [Allosphingosinicella sp.]
MPKAASTAALAALCLSMLMASLGTSIANVGLPAIAEAFSAPFDRVQWVVLAYLLAVTALIVGAGRLGDMFGRRRLLLVGIGLFTGAAIACAASPNLALLVAARGAQGLGAALMMALTMASVAEIVPRAKTGRAMGLLGTLSAIGTALGPSLGGLLVAGPGWRALFLVNLPLGLLAFLLAWRHLPVDRSGGRAGPDRFDGLGTLLLALSLTFYALATTLGRGSFGPVNAALAIAAAAGFALFAFAESRVASPLIRPAMFADRRLSASLAESGLVAALMMATLVVGPFYLSRGLGLAPAETGLAMSVGPVVAALAGMPSGALADRFGAGRSVLAGLAAVAAGSLLLALLPSSLGVGGYIAPMIVLTAGYALFQTANNSAVMAEVAAERRGLFSGLLNLSRNLGLITGASAMGAVFAAASGAGDVAAAAPAAVAAGLRATFAAGAVLALLAIAIECAARPLFSTATARV